MRTNKIFLNILPRITVIVLAMLIATGSFDLTGAAARTLALDPALHDETGPVHRPLATVGITLGQTARINVVNSPDPNSRLSPTNITVEMCFHDSDGNLILDRSRRPVQKTATIQPHHGDSLDLNGNLIAGFGSRIVIVPCVRVLSVNDGSLAIPTLELFNNLIKTTFVLNPGVARGFDPQPDPPTLPELAFGLVGITPGVTARMYVVNAQNPNDTDPPGPLTLEIEFHDANANILVDRNRHQARKVVTLNPNQADFLELNGNDIAAPGARVGIIPCVKVLRGSPTSLVAPTFEMYINVTQQTLLLSNVGDPHLPVASVPQ